MTNATPTTSGKTNPAFIHQKRYTERQRSSKRARVNVWVPEEHREELIEIASSMRDGSWNT